MLPHRLRSDCEWVASFVIPEFLFDYCMFGFFYNVYLTGCLPLFEHNMYYYPKTGTTFASFRFFLLNCVFTHSSFFVRVLLNPYSINLMSLVDWDDVQHYSFFYYCSISRRSSYFVCKCGDVFIFSSIANVFTVEIEYRYYKSLFSYLAFFVISYVNKHRWLFRL